MCVRVANATRSTLPSFGDRRRERPSTEVSLSRICLVTALISLGPNLRREIDRGAISQYEGIRSCAMKDAMAEDVVEIGRRRERGLAIDPDALLVCYARQTCGGQFSNCHRSLASESEYGDKEVARNHDSQGHEREHNLLLR